MVLLEVRPARHESTPAQRRPEERTLAEMHALSRPSSSSALLPSFSMTTMGTTMRLAPSANHLQGLHLLGKSASLPALPWWSATLPALKQPPSRLLASTRHFARPHDVPARPLTPGMQRELSELIFPLRPSPSVLAAAAAASEAARERERRKLKYAPGEKVLRISAIRCEDLPDADKGMGAGSSDPYLTFELVFDADDETGHDFVRTRTIMNAPRTVRFPDVLEMPLSESLLTGKCNATLRVRVWDDDSIEEGQEGKNDDDLMGQYSFKFNCRLIPYKIEGHVDRMTFVGVGSLYSFRVSFRYEAVPKRAPPAAETWGWGK